MALKDMIFGLSLKSDKFDSNLKKSQQELRKLAQTRLDQIRRDMADLGKNTDQLSKKRLNELVGEMKSLQKVVKVTTDDGNKLKSTIGGLKGNIITGIGQGLGQGIFGAVSSALGKLAQGVGSVFAKAKDLISESIGEAINSKRVKDSLKLALKNSGAGADSFERLDTAAGRAQAFNIDDEDMLAAQTVLARAKMPADQIESMTGGIADVAAMMNGTAKDAANVIKAVYNGQFKNMKRFGIAPQDTGDLPADVSANLQKLFSAAQGFAAQRAANDPLAGAKLQIDDIKKSFGEKILTSILPARQNVLGTLRGLLDNPKFQQTLDRFAAGFNRAVNTLQAIIENIDLKDIFGSLWEIIKEIAGFLVDTMSLGGELIGKKIRESLPGYLGGGKDKDQVQLEKYLGMSKEDRDAERKNLQKQLAQTNQLARAGVPGFAQSTMTDSAKKSLSLLDAADKGQRIVGTKLFGETYDERMQQIMSKAEKFRAAGKKTLGQIKESGLAAQAKDQASLTSTKPVVAASQAAVEKQARKQADAAKKQAEKLAKAAQKRNQFMQQQNAKVTADLRFSGPPGYGISPFAGTVR